MQTCLQSQNTLAYYVNLKSAKNGFIALGNGQSLKFFQHCLGFVFRLKFVFAKHRERQSESFFYKIRQFAVNFGIRLCVWVSSLAQKSVTACLADGK